MAMNDSEQLHYLIVLAQELNLTHAAERLHISQPGLTGFLNRLEAQLGVKLFDRTSTPIRLTDAGRLYLSEMGSLELKRQQLMRSIRSMDFSPDQTLRIGIGRNRGCEWLPELLTSLYERFPDANVDVLEDRDETMSDKILHDTLDVAIIESYLYADQLDLEPLMDEKRCFITGNRNSFLQGIDTSHSSFSEPLDLPSSFINQQTFFCPSVRNGLNFYTQQLFSGFHIAPRKLVFISNSCTRYRLALSGIGTTFLSSGYAGFIRSEQEPIYIMPGGKPFPVHLYIIYDGNRMNEMKRYFIDSTINIAHRKELDP